MENEGMQEQEEEEKKKKEEKAGLWGSTSWIGGCCFCCCWQTGTEGEESRCERDSRGDSSVLCGVLVRTAPGVEAAAAAAAAGTGGEGSGVPGETGGVMLPVSEAHGAAGEGTETGMEAAGEEAGAGAAGGKSMD